MSDWHLLAAAAYAAWCAAAWRFRGGGIVATGSTQLARALCGLLMAAPLSYAAASPALLLLAPALWLGVALVGWGDFMDMTRVRPAKSEELVSPLVRWLGPGTLAHDLAGMSLTGLVMLAPAAAIVAALGASPWPLLVPALLLGPIYALGWRLAPRRGTEAAEWLAGAAIGAALWVAMA